MTVETHFISEAIVLAAGLGTRLRPFTELTPKALLPVMNIPVAQYQLDSLRACGVKTVVMNVHHHAELATAGLNQLDHAGMDLYISHEDQLLLGSGGGLKQAAEFLQGPRFFFANSDVLCDVDWNQLMLCHTRLRKKWGVQITLTVFPSPPSGGSYSEVIFDPRTQLIQSLGEGGPGRPFFVGAGVIEREALASLPLGQALETVPTILRPAIGRGQAGVYLTQGHWLDIGSPKLWHETHLSLLEMFETGRCLKKPSMQVWWKRIVAQNQRLGDRKWIAQGSRRPRSRVDFYGPSYLNLPPGGPCPAEIGPGVVLYGGLDHASFDSAGVSLSRGIGYGGKWVQFG